MRSQGSGLQAHCVHLPLMQSDTFRKPDAALLGIDVLVQAGIRLLGNIRNYGVPDDPVEKATLNIGS